MIFLSLGFATSKYKYNRFISSGNEALEDFKTLVRVDYDRRVIISCRRSSLAFLGETLLWGFVIVIVFRALVKLGYWVFGLGGGGYGSGVFVSRRMGVLLEEKWWLRKGGLRRGKGRRRGLILRFQLIPFKPSRDVVKLGNIGSFYRSSVDFVLNYCSSFDKRSTFAQIEGRMHANFFFGLVADSIGLQKR
ncbi:hypothetical protein IFM89_014348 [Coptis chinensis]|uniref:Transmembrane protein n=1 Tax=Coptis chinensis TaxID=261450 RepID=A0A835IP15_9MAGN|nr:hypothetical protein IFM89_014348 [Coptis chinensis]